MNKQETLEFQLKNSEIALKRWMTVPPENVSPILSKWREDNGIGPVSCGTIACLGGWVAVMPEFIALGITTRDFGAPGFASDTGPFSSCAVAEYLFGEYEMFEHRYNDPYDPYNPYDLTAPPGCTDHELVQHRLTENIKRLKAALV